MFLHYDLWQNISVRSHLGSMTSLNVGIDYVYSTTHEFLWNMSQIQKKMFTVWDMNSFR